MRTEDFRVVASDLYYKMLDIDASARSVCAKLNMQTHTRGSPEHPPLSAAYQVFYHNALFPLRNMYLMEKAQWVRIPPLPHLLGKRDVKHATPKVQRAFINIAR